MAANSPSAWAEAQRLFHESYVDGPSTMPRMTVRWRTYDTAIVSRAYRTRAAPLAALASGVMAVFRRRTNEDPVIAVWTEPSIAGSPAVLILEFEPWRSVDEGQAVLVGECTINAALCLELSEGSIIWPTYNPRPPTNWLPRL